MNQRAKCQEGKKKKKRKKKDNTIYVGTVGEKEKQ